MMKSNYSKSKATFITFIIILATILMGLAGCGEGKNIHSKPYTIRINGNLKSYSLMDGNNVVATFTDSKLDSIILQDNQ